MKHLFLVALLVFPIAAHADTIRIIDGDTFAINGEKIRLLDVDTPESHKSRCARESRLADAATNRLRQILASGPVRIDRDGRDRYGRTLAHVYVNEREVGQQLIQEGYALPWQPGRAAWEWRLSQWCP